MGKNLKGKEIGKNITQRPNGKYSVKLMAGGRRIERIFDTLAEAKSWKTDMQHAANHGGIGSMDPNMTVNAWFDRWAKNRGPALSPRTMDGHRSKYNNHIRPAVGHMRIGSVTPDDCQLILSQLADTHKASSIRQIRNTLSVIFSAAVDGWVILRSPVTKSGVQIPHSAAPSEPRRIMDADAMNRFLAAITGTVHEAAYRLVLETGLRVGELIGLCWSDVDMDQRMLHVRQQLYYTHQSGHTKDLACWHWDRPKSRAGFRNIPLTDEAVRILTVLRLRSVVTPDTPPDMRDLVFLGRDGWPVTDRAYDAHLNYVCNRRGLQHISMHTLRHEFASGAVHNNIDIAALAQIMGHSSPAVTLGTYVHASDSSVRESVSQIGSGVAGLSLGS